MFPSLFFAMNQTYYERMTIPAKPYMAQAQRIVAQCEDDRSMALAFSWIQEAVLRNDDVLAHVLNSALEVALARRMSERVADPRDLNTFMRDELMAIYGYAGLALSGAAEASTAIRICYHLLNHERAGDRVYELSLGLAQQLLDTELRGLDSDQLRGPYESFSLVIPSGLGLQIYNDQTAYHDLVEILVVEDNSQPGERIWWCSLIGKGKANPYDDALFYFGVHLRDGEPLSRALDEVDERFRESRLLTNEQREYAEWRKPFHLLMNAMIYATWPEAEREHVIGNKQARQLWDRLQKLPKGPKRDRLRDEFSHVQPQRRTVLGRHVIYISREQAEAEDRENAVRTGKPLTLRVRVQGHWRNQPYGPGKTLRRPKWIRPFWKGPEDGALSEAVHHLGTRE